MLKKILYTFCALSLLLSSGVAFAQNYGSLGSLKDITGVTIDKNTINVTTPNSNTNISGKSGSLNINANGTTLNLDKSGTGANLTVIVGGKTIDVNSGDGNLSVQVEKGLTASDKESFVSLTGNSDLMIKTNADLNAYNRLVVEQRPAIQNVSVENSGLKIKYNQPARFLAIFSTDLNATAVVNNDGTVSIDLPWYSFLYSKDSDQVKLAIETSLQKAGSNKQVDVNLLGSSSSLNVGTNNGANSTIQFRNNAHALNIVTNSIDGSVSLSGQ